MATDPFGPDRESSLDRLAGLVNSNRDNMDRAVNHMTSQDHGIMRRAAGAAWGGIQWGARQPGGLGTPFTGMQGPMFQGQGPMALAYHGGMGQSINDMTGGYFARSAGFSQGMASGVLSGLASDELGLRTTSYFSGLASDLSMGALDVAYGGRYGMMPGLQAERQRGVSGLLSGQRFSGFGETGTGFGVRSQSGMARGLADSLGSAITQTFDDSGKAMSREDLEALQGSTLGAIGSTRLGAMMNDDPATQRAKMKTVVDSIKSLSENLQVSYEAAGQIQESLSYALDPVKNAELMKAVGTNRIDGLTGIQQARAFGSELGAARSLGAFDPGQAFAIASSGMSRQQAMFQSAQSGSIPMELMSLHGGANDAERRQNTVSADARYGMNFGFSSPGMAAMYQTDPSGVAAMINSQDLMSTMQSGASAMMASPFAAMTARFSPRTMDSMRGSGLAGAFSYADQQGVMMEGMMGGLMGPDDKEAFRMQQFQRAGGIESEALARGTYRRYQSILGGLESGGLSASAARGSLAFAARAQDLGFGDFGKVGSTISAFNSANPNRSMNSLSDSGARALLSVGGGADDPALLTLRSNLAAYQSEYVTGSAAGDAADDGIAGFAEEARLLGFSPEMIQQALDTPATHGSKFRYRGTTGVMDTAVNFARYTGSKLGEFFTFGSDEDHRNSVRDKTTRDSRFGSLGRGLGASHGGTALAIRKRGLRNSAESISSLLTGTSSGSTGARVEQLIRGGASGATAIQSRLLGNFGPGGVTEDAVRSMDLGEMSDYFLAIQGKDEAHRLTDDLLARVPAMTNRKELLAMTLERQKHTTPITELEAFTTTFANRYKDELSTMTMGSLDRPMYVVIKEDRRTTSG